MKLRLRIGLLMVLAAAAAYSGAEAFRTLRPTSRDELPMQIYAAFIDREDSAQFFLKSREGHVAVYRDAKYKSEPELTAIETAALRSADRAMLEKGIPVGGKSELLELLEDLGS